MEPHGTIDANGEPFIFKSLSTSNTNTSTTNKITSLTYQFTSQQLYKHLTPTHVHTAQCFHTTQTLNMCKHNQLCVYVDSQQLTAF